MTSSVTGFVFFFFSSRRRHTRCSRDWSSDVCSSDLLEISEGLCEERDAVETLSGKPLEFCFGHDCSTKTLRGTAGARGARERLQASCAASASCAIAPVSRRFRRARLTYLASRSERLLYNTPARLVHRLPSYDYSTLKHLSGIHDAVRAESPVVLAHQFQLEWRLVALDFIAFQPIEAVLGAARTAEPVST